MFSLEMASSPPSVRLIIDTDGVSDDVRAISIAMQHPDVEVIAFTAVHGCVSVEQAVANVARTQRANGMKKMIPIYKGAATPLIKKKEEVDESFFFGKDGLGDLPNNFPEVEEGDFTAHEPNETAAAALIRLTKEYPDAVLVAIGPLTNVALALKLDPSFSPSRLVCMGGNYHGTGNVNSHSTAEFNFYGDPEAAFIVLEEMPCPVTLVPWEAFVVDGAEHQKEVDYHAHLQGDEPLARYFTTTTSKGRAELAKTGRQYAYCDEIAVSTAIDPEKAIRKSKELRVSVELSGTLTRGQIAVDWIDQLWPHDDNTRGVDRRRRPVQFVTEYDVKFVDGLVREAVRKSKGE